MRAWGGHILLVLLITATSARAIWLRPTSDELEVQLAPLLTPQLDPMGNLRGLPADSRETVAALHRLLNRPGSTWLEQGQQLTETLLASKDSLLTDFALTTDLCQLSFHTTDNVPETQEEWVLGRTPLPLDGPWWRRFILYQRKVGGKQVGGRKRLNNQELIWYRQALRGESLPKDLLFNHLLQRSGGFSKRAVPKDH